MATEESPVYSLTLRGWPVLSNPTVTGHSSNGANLWVTTDTGSGRLYWVADTSTADPTPAMIKQGLNGEGQAATAGDSSSVAAPGQQGPFAMIPFPPNTNVGFWIVQETSSGDGFSNVESGRFTTTDSGEITPPEPEVPPEVEPPDYTPLTTFYEAEREVPGVTPAEMAGLPGEDFIPDEST